MVMVINYSLKESFSSGFSTYHLRCRITIIDETILKPLRQCSAFKRHKVIRSYTRSLDLKCNRDYFSLLTGLPNSRDSF